MFIVLLRHNFKWRVFISYRGQFTNLWKLYNNVNTFYFSSSLYLCKVKTITMPRNWVSFCLIEQTGKNYSVTWRLERGNLTKTDEVIDFLIRCIMNKIKRHHIFGKSFAPRYLTQTWKKFYITYLRLFRLRPK